MENAKRHGFYKEASYDLPEIDGQAHVFRHTSGARLLYLQNEDNNKGFSITFKTPAADDTGVFHILEHSVLCGSEKYPVKEPFVDLLKSSMETFLNAMTYPDKTMFPVSSTNDKDLMNLTSVYLDAVFHPNIYSNKDIFKQEGWHLEFDADKGVLEYNGVVFNEMKGALSDPESVLLDTLQAALFPDTTYRFESGGTPDSIPSLTYESFLDTHKRHYRPSNSYIVLYGNMDAEPFFELFDEVLRGADNVDEEINPLDLQPSVENMGVRAEMETSPEGACAAYGAVIARSGEREKLAAAKLVRDALMGSNESPMKRALLQADIADEIEGALLDALVQPYLIVSARGLHGEDSLSRLCDILSKEGSRLAEELDEKLIEAALNSMEFSLREADFGYPNGVIYSMVAMKGWLYDDSPDAALLYIRYEELIERLRQKIGTGYYEDLVREMFVEAGHKASAQIVPVQQSGPSKQEKKLEEMTADLSKADLEKISEGAKALHEVQMAPDSPEALATLPRLTREDVGEPALWPLTHMEEIGLVKVMRHDIETHGIVYITRYFDLRGLTFEELPYAAILSLVLGKMDTNEHTALEIDTISQSELGSLGFYCETFATSEDAEDVRPMFAVSASCLDAKVQTMASLMDEILTGTDFNDLFRIEKILTQVKVAKEQAFTMTGNAVALVRAASHVMPTAQIGEEISNIEFYKHVKEILADYEVRGQLLADKLKDVAARIFTDDGCLLSFAGSDEAYRQYCAAEPELGISLDQPKDALVLPDRKPANEAFAVPADIAFNALVGNRDSSDFSGLWVMLRRVLSYDYLWNEVRVLGGAYGTSFSSNRLGLTSFTSYRDPHVRETFDRYHAAPEWLASFSPEKSQFEGFVISAAAIFDKPLKPRAMAKRQISMYLNGYTYEEYMRYRSQVLEASLDDLKSLSSALANTFEESAICIVGNKAMIEQADMGIPIVELFDI